jgi:hypothetical protein
VEILMVGMPEMESMREDAEIFDVPDLEDYGKREINTATIVA